MRSLACLLLLAACNGDPLPGGGGDGGASGDLGAPPTDLSGPMSDAPVGHVDAGPAQALYPWCVGDFTSALCDTLLGCTPDGGLPPGFDCRATIGSLCDCLRQGQAEGLYGFDPSAAAMCTATLRNDGCAILQMKDAPDACKTAVGIPTSQTFECRASGGSGGSGLPPGASCGMGDPGSIAACAGVDGCQACISRQPGAYSCALPCRVGAPGDCPPGLACQPSGENTGVVLQTLDCPVGYDGYCG